MHRGAKPGERAEKIDLDEIYREIAKLDKYESEEELRKRLPEEQVRIMVRFFSNGRDFMELAEIVYKIYEQADIAAASYGYDERPIEDIVIQGSKMIVYAVGGKSFVYRRRNSSII